MTATDLLARAADAWAMVIRSEEPMHVLVALDYIEDEAANRREAALALYHVAADWLRGMLPDTVSTDTVEFALRAVEVCKLLEDGQYLGAAEYDRVALHERTNSIRLSHILRPRVVSKERSTAAAQWGTWCVYAKRAIALCLEAAAQADPMPA